MKRLAIHKNLVVLLLVIFAVVAMHTLQSIHRDVKQRAGETVVPDHLLAR